MSDIEHGKKMPADYTLKKIMSVLDIEFHEDVSIQDEMLEKMYEIYRLYSELDLIKIDILYKQLVEKQDIYKNSYAFLTYDLINLIYKLNIDYDLNASSLLINKINKFIHLLTKEEIAVYNDVKGMYFYKSRKLIEAEKFYENAQELATTNVIKGMVCYHLTLLYQLKNNELDALIYCEKSISYFNKELNIQRILNLEIYKATCYSREGLFNKAIAIYKTVIKKAYENNCEKIVALAYDNLAWTFLKAKRYNEAIKSVEKSLIINQDNPFDEIYIYEPFALFKLKQYEKCIDVIHKNVKYLENSIQLIFLKALEAIINENGDLFVSFMYDYIHSLSGQYDDYEMYLFAYHELLEYYKSVNDQENIIHTYDKMMEIINLVS